VAIEFEFQGNIYSLETDSNDLDFLRIYCIGTWETKNESEKQKLFKVVSEINETAKYIKTVVVSSDTNDNVIIVGVSFDTIIINKNDFNYYFKKMLDKIIETEDIIIDEMKDD